MISKLSLDRTISLLAGAPPTAIGANSLNIALICPVVSGAEAAWVDPDTDVLAPRSLITMANHFEATQVQTRPVAGVCDGRAEIRGQEAAKRRWKSRLQVVKI